MSDPIAAARAMIEPLTGYTPGPWTFETESGDWPDHSLIGGSGDPVLWWDFDLGFRYSTADAALIAAAPDLRDMVATLADALEAERAKVAEARLEGWRAGREAAAGIVDGTARYHMSDPDDIEVVRLTAAEIRALPEPKEAIHE